MPLSKEEETWVSEEGKAEFDENYDSAVKLVIETGEASIDMLRKKLRVRFSIGARMLEAMETQGVVGPLRCMGLRKVFGERKGGEA